MFKTVAASVFAASMTTTQGGIADMITSLYRVEEQTDASNQVSIDLDALGQNLGEFTVGSNTDI